MPPLSKYTKMRLLAAAGDPAAKAKRDDELAVRKESGKNARAALKEKIQRGDKEAIAERDHRRALNAAGKRRRRAARRAQAGQTVASGQDLEAEEGDEEESEESDAEEQLEDSQKMVPEEEQGWGVNSAYPTTRNGEAMNAGDWRFKGKVLVFPETELQR